MITFDLYRMSSHRLCKGEDPWSWAMQSRITPTSLGEHRVTDRRSEIGRVTMTAQSKTARQRANAGRASVTSQQTTTTLIDARSRCQAVPGAGRTPPSPRPARAGMRRTRGRDLCARRSVWVSPVR